MDCSHPSTSLPLPPNDSIISSSQIVTRLQTFFFLGPNKSLISLPRRLISALATIPLHKEPLNFSQAIVSAVIMLHIQAQIHMEHVSAHDWTV